MTTTIRLTVLTPERVLLQVEHAIKVRLRLSDLGWISLYRNHAPLLAETAAGPVQYETEVETGEMHVGAGILSVADNTVEVLTSGMYGPELESEEDEEDRAFDRLARQLLATLTEDTEQAET